MKMVKTLLLGSMLAAGVMGTTSAFAATQWLVGGSTSGASVIGPGATNVSFLGVNTPCTSQFSVSDTGGVLEVTSATFTGSATCASIKANSLPWAVSVPSGSGPWTATVSGVSVVAAGVFNCAGNASVSVDTSGHVTLTGTLGLCGLSSSALTSAPSLSAQ